MRRLLCTAALSGLFFSVLAVLPVEAAPSPHAVRATVRSHVESATSGEAFSTLGATWDRASTGTVEVRTHDHAGWSAWTALTATDAGPDAQTPDAASATTQVTAPPMWVGHADAYQTRTHGLVRGLRVVTVDPGTSAADANPGGVVTGPGTASAAPANPTIYSRADWGADESLRSVNGASCTTPDYSSTIKVGFVHHTDGVNGYAPDDVPGILRGIYAYHVKTNGWCDIGYNFLVDAFGRVWEGRYGGTTRPVIGAHTGGHNVNSFGVAMIGTFSTVEPTPEMLTALKGLMAWKMAPYYLDPHGTGQLTSAGGGTSKYPAGTTTTFDVISGHRDAGNTECPGDAMYAHLPEVRDGVAAAMGASLVAPSTTTGNAVYAGTGPAVRAGVLEAQTWTLDVKDASGTIVRTYAGQTSTSLTQRVDLKDATGAWLPPGRYSLVLSSAAGVDTAVPWTGTLDIAATSAYVPVTPARLLDTRTPQGGHPGALGPHQSLDLTVTGVGGVPSSGVTAVALNVTGVAGSSATFLAAYPTGTTWPGTSSLNLAPRQTHAALVTPKVVPSSGKVTVLNGSGSTHVVVDVVGYYTGTGSRYSAVTPGRVLDTRAGGTPFAADETRQVAVAGKAGVPTDATAVIANVTVTRAARAGYLTVFPGGSSRPDTSTLNVAAGETATNRVVLGLGGGALGVYAQSGPVDVIVDVVGYLSATGSLFSALDPARVLDTRSGNGVPGTSKAGAGSTTTVTVAGRGGVPADATSVVLTLTTTGVEKEGYVTAWSGSGTRPDVSDVNTWVAHDVANLVVVKLSGGRVSLYSSSGPLHLVADVVGYYR